MVEMSVEDDDVVQNTARPAEMSVTSDNINVNVNHLSLPFLHIHRFNVILIYVYCVQYLLHERENILFGCK